MKSTPAFALGGMIVKTEAQARKILATAIAEKSEWLIPQARNVAILIKRAADAKRVAA